uniref:Uncharacterized protein n=1 Tax=Arundo donax TaxID=35708 RepID=A0A0A9GLY6_ARUDO
MIMHSLSFHKMYLFLSISFAISVNKHGCSQCISSDVIFSFETKICLLFLWSTYLCPHGSTVLT